MLSYLRGQDRKGQDRKEQDRKEQDRTAVVVVTTEKVIPGSFWKREAGAAGRDANNV